jgi:hypothetical protein
MANHISGDHSLGETFNPVYLIDHFNRVWPSLKALESQISGQTSTSVLIIIALALALLRLRGRASNPLASFYLAIGLLYFLSLLAAFLDQPICRKLSSLLYLDNGLSDRPRRPGLHLCRGDSAPLEH